MEFKTSKRLDKWVENHRKKAVYLMQQQVNSLYMSSFQVVLSNVRQLNVCVVVRNLQIMLIRKENNVMGITAKPVSKMQSIMRKMENQLEAERKVAKEKKEAKKKNN